MKEYRKRANKAYHERLKKRGYKEYRRMVPAKLFPLMDKYLQKLKAEYKEG